MQTMPSSSRAFTQRLSSIAPWISQEQNPIAPTQITIDKFPPWLTPLVTATHTGLSRLFIFSPDQDAIPSQLRAQLSALPTQKLSNQFQKYWQIALRQTRFCSLLGSTVNYNSSNSSIYRIFDFTQELEGESIGLAVTLSFIQYLSHMPLTQSLITSATIDETGQLGPVLKLKDKLSVLESYPHINHVGVCESQRVEAQMIINDLGLDQRVKVSSWPNLESVLNELITKEKSLAWKKQIGDSLHQETQLNHLLSCIIYNRLGNINKTALLSLLSTIELNLEDNNPLKGSLRDSIFIIKRHLNSPIASSFVHDKFDLLTQDFKHVSNATWFGLPLEALPSQFNIDQYLTNWAHLVQDVCDCTDDEPKLSSQVVSHAHQVLDKYDGGEGRARLTGALARYYFSFGNLSKALSLSMSSIYIWCSLPMYVVHDEVTYPLALLYRIAAAMPEEHELYDACEKYLYPLTVQCFQLSKGSATSWKYVFESWCKYQLSFHEKRTKLLDLCFYIINHEVTMIDRIEYDSPMPNLILKSIAGFEEHTYIAYLMLNYLTADDARYPLLSQKLNSSKTKHTFLLKNLLQSLVPLESEAQQSDLLCWRGYHKMKKQQPNLEVVHWFKFFHQYT